MKILIAGGGGYIGSALIPKLLERGYDVEVVDLFWFGRHLPEEAKATCKDVFDLKEAELKGVEQVILMAGLSNDPMSEYSPSKNFIANAAAPAIWHTSRSERGCSASSMPVPARSTATSSTSYATRRPLLPPTIPTGSRSCKAKRQ